MNNKDLTKVLMAMQDKEYAKLQVRTIPTVDPSRIIGVRTPDL